MSYEFAQEERLLNSHKLSKFMRDFFGYGQLESKIWFVGMEEASAGTFEDTERRVNAWFTRGCPTLDDLRGYHEAIGVTECFVGRPKLQTTWRGLMRIEAASRCQSPTVEDLRHFQANGWGSSGGNVALMELFPLPKPSRKSWPYSDWSDLAYLRSDRSYRSYLASNRTERLRSLIQDHRPKAIVFYGAEHRAHFEKIVGENFSSLVGTKRPAGYIKTGATLAFHIWHPQYLPNTDFELIGSTIAAAETCP